MNELWNEWSKRAPRWLKDPFAGFSHALGALLSIAALVVMLCFTQGGALRIVGLAIYGCSLILLYTASALAHLCGVTEKWDDRLERLDYAAIFFLIAGTYTPICLTVLRGPWGWSMLAVEWTMAIIGATMAIFSGPWRRWMLLMYLPMSWLIVIAVVPLLRSMPLVSLIWLVSGGMVYSIGSLIFITHRPRLWPRVFGSHDLWHCMVLTGSICHFIAIYLSAV